MANEYKQGIDRVAVDESFPYPIKLEYDNQYIYLTVLRIPEPEELKHSPWVQNQLRRGHEIRSYQERLALCVECDYPKKYKLLSRPPYRHPTSCYPLSTTLNPTRGGNFYRKNNETNVIENPILGVRYRLPIEKCINKTAIMCKSRYGSGYSRIRGTFRFNTKHKGADYCSTLRIPSPIYERTGVYSNTATITYRE